MPELMKLFKIANLMKLTKEGNGEVGLVHCNIVNNDYQCNSMVLYTITALQITASQRSMTVSK